MGMGRHNEVGPMQTPASVWMHMVGSSSVKPKTYIIASASITYKHTIVF